MSHDTARVAFVSGPARVALYLRAETLVQATRQAALLHQAVDSERGWHIVAVFSDLTGTPWGGRRPCRDGAMTSARTGFDVLMVSSLDRLTRNTDELMELIQQLTAADVRLCVTLRPQGPQSDLEIRVVDEFLVGVYRSLAGQHDAVWDLPAGPSPAGDGPVSPGLLDEVVDYFEVYGCDPELTVAVPELDDGQPRLTIRIAALGGGTPGRAYADNGWVYAVHLDGDLVASGADLHSGGLGRTHEQMAAVLAVLLADTDRVPALAGHADRLSLWAHDVEAGDGDE